MQDDPVRKPSGEDTAADCTNGPSEPAETQPHASSADSQADSESWQLPGGRYDVVGEIGRGGMGVVLRAIDTDVQRPLAVKVMRSPATADQQARFLDEARITGQLQHPGVPPVHEIGRLSDGLPFFSMKLIEGRTLTELLRQRQTPQADLPRFLKVFEQIAQTVAYAHSRGIIHRDLKPSNIMVGAFGEVQVMDWGLAKRLFAGPEPECGRCEEADAVSREPAAEGSTADVVGPFDQTIEATPPARDTDGLTQAGQVLGTPAYMPPEQALGKIDQLDQRADVFGLGAILCEVLTGKPPYVAEDRMQVFHLAAGARLDDCFGRLAASAADPELVELTRRCLAPVRDERPRDAGVVSEVVTAYLESVQQRLKQTEIERAEAQTRAVEERKRREVEQAKARTERQKRRVTLALAASLLLLAAGGGVAGWWYQQDQARQTVARAELRARQDNLNREVSTTLQEAERQRVELHARLTDPRRVHVLLSDIDEWERFIETTRSAWQRADTLAQSDSELLREEVGERLRKLDEALQADEQDCQLAKKLDTVRQNTGLAVGGKFDPRRAAAEYPKALREAGYDVENGDAEKVAQRIRESPIRYALLAALDHWALFDNSSRIVAVSQQAEDLNPWRQRLRDVQQREDHEGLKVLVAEVEFERQSPQTIVMLAAIMRAAGLDPVPVLRRALIHYPNDYNLHFALAGIAKDPVERIGSYRAALAVRPDSTSALCNLASILIDAGEPDEAIRHCRKALAIDPNFGWIHNNLGHALRRKEDLKGAIASFQQAIALDPDNAMAHLNLGGSLARTGDQQGAIRHFRKAIDIDPKFAWAHYSLGMVLTAERDLDAAVTSYRKAIAIDPQFAEAHCNLGLVLDRQGKFVEAFEAVRRGHELGSQRKDWNYPSAQWVAQVERHVELDRKLTAVLAGEEAPADASERLEMAKLLFLHKKNYAEAVRFYAGAFEAEPNLAGDLRTGHRYNAVCAAALAIAERGDRKLTDEQRRTWREQARAWLQADLGSWQKLLEGNPQAATFINQALRHWQTDPDLASIRDKSALADLPREEQTAWRQLWAAVQDLVNRIETKKK